MNIIHGVCVGSWTKFEQYVVPHLEDHPCIALENQTSIAHAYNQIIDAAQIEAPDILVLQHDDLEITDPQWVAKLEAVFAEPDVGIVGVAGARDVTGLAWWFYQTVGHQMTDGIGFLDFGERSGDVEALEGSFLALGPWFLQNMRFDEHYPGFHGYDSIATDVYVSGKRVIVADIDTWHHTPGGFRSESSQADWDRSSDIYDARWGFTR